MLEWLQAFILAVGLILCWRADKIFGLFTAPAWLILIARELSWGRVFYPLGVRADGPFFLPLNHLWYGPAVYPSLTAVVLIWVFAIIKYKLHMIPLRMIKQRVFPWNNFLLILAGTIATYLAEHNHLSVAEEMAETVVYIGLIVLALKFNRAMLSSKSEIAASLRSS
ncbi:hypothetical protein SDC9_156699 [bioreactor metagenome]|uniref:Uncharacterized protein n=1 Tax=bioreactor metagenome TaxID=1076179 RepID=A0A645F7T1_9ZZZZ